MTYIIRDKTLLILFFYIWTTHFGTKGVVLPFKDQNVLIFVSKETKVSDINNLRTKHND